MDNFYNPNQISEKSQHQNIVFALVGGSLIAIICGLLWATITVATEYQIGFMAIGVGFLVGIAVRFFGAGVDPIFNYIGASLALVACLIGEYFTLVGFFAKSESMNYLQVMKLLDFDLLISSYKETLNPMTLLFIAIAVYEGFRFSTLPESEDTTQSEYTSPSYLPLRLPLIMASFTLLLGFGIYLFVSIPSLDEFTYESGMVESTGELVDGKEEGKWTYYYEDGNVQSEGEYLHGAPVGEWKYYYSSAQISTLCFYKNGLQDGMEWIYFENGQLSSTSQYRNGRLIGEFRSFHENGTIRCTGQYQLDRYEGKWNWYFEDGTLNQTTEFVDGDPLGESILYNESGNIIEKMNYDENNITHYLEIRDADNKILVKNGSGQFVSRNENGQILSEGEIKNELQTGIWTYYFENGEKSKISNYVDGKEKVVSIWNEEGKMMIQDGNGLYQRYSTLSGKLAEEGMYQDGLQEGNWKVYFEDTGELNLELHMKGGEYDGGYQMYNMDGVTIQDGNFVKNKSDGEWKWYYEDGIVQTEAQFIDGKKHGLQKFYSVYGDLLKQEEYNQGQFVRDNLFLF